MDRTEDSRLPRAVPPPIRVDREQLEKALRPVVAAIVDLQGVVERMFPALQAIADHLSKVSHAAETIEEAAGRQSRRKR